MLGRRKNLEFKTWTVEIWTVKNWNLKFEIHEPDKWTVKFGTLTRIYIIHSYTI